MNHSGSDIASVGWTIELPRVVSVYNSHGSQVLYVGWGSDVSTANGLPVPVGESRKFRLSYLDEMWAIASGAGTVALVTVVHGKGNPPALDVLSLSPVLWLDASDTSTITESGGAVSQWDDKSGNGYDLTQATSANQPTTGTNTQNGRNVITFDGSDRLVAATASDWIFLHSAQSVVFAVFKAGTVTDPNSIYAVWATTATTAVPTGAFFAHDTRNGTQDDAIRHIVGPSGFGGNIRVLHNQENQLAGNVWASVTVVGDIANATVADRSTMRLNGGTDLTSTWSGSVAVNSSDPRNAFAVGAGVNESNNWDLHLVGDIAEVIVVDGTLTAQQISDAETYLADKWGITI
jgi:hypothetical protein